MSRMAEPSALAGRLEIVSILVHLVSSTFLLYGNMFGGENMLDRMAQSEPR